MPRFRENRLNGLFPLSYAGVIPVSPSNFVFNDGAPTSHDARNFYIGDFWLDTSTDVAPNFVPPKLANLYILVSLDKGIATWIPFAGGSGSVITLTGNTGGPVPPTAGNINVLGDTTVGLTVNGNPGTSTLTITTVGGHPIGQTITGNTGGAVPFNSSGNINVVGDGTTATVAGNPGTNTLTITAITGGAVVETLTGNTGGPVGPSGNNINVVGDGTTISITGNPGTHTLTASVIANFAEDFNTDDSMTVTPALGIVGVHGLNGITTSAFTAHTIGISTTGIVPTTFTANTGTATPSSNNLNIFGDSGVITTTASGSTVTVDLTSATDGQVIIGSSAGNPAWNTLTAGANITITNGHNSITIAASGGGGGGNANSFSYFLQAAAVSVTGDGTNYLFGAGLAGISAIFSIGGASGPGWDNTGGAIFPGDGGTTPFSFTAPTTGHFYFRVTCASIGFSSSHNSGFFQFLHIRSPSNFLYTGWIGNPANVFTSSAGSLSNAMAFTADCAVRMGAGEQMQFNWIVSGDGKTIEVISSNGTGFQGTWVSGWQVS